MKGSPVRVRPSALSHRVAVSGNDCGGGGQRWLNFARAGGPSRLHGFALKLSGDTAPFTALSVALSRKTLSR